ncbi:hypothetical protein [Sphingobium sp.]|uniref:hypothetical protein n=1 Tax=Sphingobium sp. TaxID=1912891 RepID=UPI0035C78A1C
MSRADLPIIAEFISLLAERADQFAAMAGVGGMETAGHLISYLDENPRDLEPWMNGGFMELPDNWIERGSLTHHAMNGKIVPPRTVRQARVIKSLKDKSGEGG